MSAIPGETLALYEDLVPFPANLREIRYRKDGRLAIGLFIRNEDKKTVVGMVSDSVRTPYLFDVESDDANPAFEHPYGFADKAGRVILEHILGDGASQEETAA